MFRSTSNATPGRRARASHLTRFTAASLAASALLFANCGSESEPARLAGQDCLVIVLDALSADHLGSYGGHPQASPTLDALAASGVRFERAWSQSSWTLASTASLMTGLYQESHLVDTPSQALHPKANTLAEAFRVEGYECIGLTQNLFASGDFGMGQGFDQFRPMMQEARKDGFMAAAVIEQLASQGTRGPRFVYAHLRRPHAPYDPPPELLALFETGDYSGKITGTPEDLQRHNVGLAPMGPQDLEQLRALYDAGIRAVDDELRTIFDSIDMQNTLVVVVSDHGDAFDQHGVLGHGPTSFEEMVRIPLLVAHPSLAPGALVQTPAMSIDLLPTVAELFGLAVQDSDLPGRSLVPELTGASQGARLIFTSSRLDHGNQQFAVHDGRHKLILSPDQDQRVLYDLQKDPGETKDLTSVHPALTVRLEQEIADWRARQVPLPRLSAKRLKHESQNAMKALGYFGDE